MMERLTQWTENGASLVLDNPQNTEEARTQLMEKFKLACNKLAELEDKIEQGTLIEKPPVKKGEWVYVIHREKSCSLFNNEPLYRKKGVWRVVDKIFLNNDNTFTISTLAVSTGGYKHRSIVKSTTFNKSWFLTKAEAEKRLKEIQE